jgi:hypothetical protein
MAMADNEGNLGADVNPPEGRGTDVDSWIAGYVAGLAAAKGAPEDAGYPGFEDEYLGVKEAFELPDELPPMRLPAVDELAAMARESALIDRLNALAGWLGTGREVDEDGNLDDDAETRAARELGIAPGETELPYLWDLGLDAEFITIDDETSVATPGEMVQVWADSKSDDVLDGWSVVLDCVLGGTLELAAALHGAPGDLDLAGHGLGMAIAIFLSRGHGIRLDDLSDALRTFATEDLPPDTAAASWDAWVSAHGEPARMLLDVLAELGAVTLEAESEDGEEWIQVRFTPLALWAMREQLLEAGVGIALLPAPDQMTASDLLAMADAATEAEYAAEVTAWRVHRSPEAAARELLAAAADADPGSRLLAITEVTEIGAEAEPAWRDALGTVSLRGYAKATLAQLGGLEPGSAYPAALEPGADDVAWMLTDLLMVEAWDDDDDEESLDPEAVAARISEFVPPGSETAVFEAMARTAHPDSVDVLTMVGRTHPDKKIAKAARKAAYKAASRKQTIRLSEADPF